MAVLYQHLKALNKSLCSITTVTKQATNDHGNTDQALANRELPSALYVKLNGQVSKACNLLKDVTTELLRLSVLIPAAPWVS